MLILVNVLRNKQSPLPSLISPQDPCTISMTSSPHHCGQTPSLLSALTSLMRLSLNTKPPNVVNNPRTHN